MTLNQDKVIEDSLAHGISIVLFKYDQKEGFDIGRVPPEEYLQLSEHLKYIAENSMLLNSKEKPNDTNND